MKKPSTERLMKIISTATFWAGIALCAYSIIALLTEGPIPAGTCPILSSKPIMIASVVLLVTSFVTSFFTGKKNKDTAGGNE